MSTPAAEAYANALNQPLKKVWTPPAQIGRELTHADRCDKCGAHAYVRTESYSQALPLFWCAHHYTEVERTGYFGEDTHVIHDERSFLKEAVHAQATVDTTNYKGKP